MPKIAIIQFSKNSYRREYDEDSYRQKIAEHISDWTEVSQEDFQTLQDAKYIYNFEVITRPEDEPRFIADTVQAYLKKIEAEKKAREDAQKRYEAKKAEAALKRKQKMLEKLKAELEGKNANL
jgi:hypothetical protein